MEFKEFLNSEELHVHIDDERPPKSNNFLWLKNYQDALNWLNHLPLNSKIKRINFDNDMGDTYPGHDGYDILKKLLEKVSDGMEMPKEIMVHTQNQVNRPAMMNYIKNFCNFKNIQFSTKHENYTTRNEDRDFLTDGLVFVFS